MQFYRPSAQPRRHAEQLQIWTRSVSSRWSATSPDPLDLGAVCEIYATLTTAFLASEDRADYRDPR
jgi:hypothetical protein